MDMESMIEQVYKAIEFYNRYREPEAKAILLKIDDDKIYVVFRGSFCRTCGVNDWVEDFRYVLEDVGIDNELLEIIEPSGLDGGWRIGVFKLSAKIGFK